MVETKNEFIIYYWILITSFLFFSHAVTPLPHSSTSQGGLPAAWDDRLDAGNFFRLVTRAAIFGGW